MNAARDLLSRHRTALVVAALFLLVASIYGQVRHHSFIDLDDGDYVLENGVVREGLTLPGAAWALTATRATNWHPLTWISHMADVSLFGLDPAGPHLVNAALHAANSALLFLLLLSLTSAFWESATVAALFAVHPLHVESVAWISERKDLLCTLFFFLAAWSHGKYARGGGKRWYAALLAATLLGLAAKPMAVTLPFVLLLLDYWPLSRFGTSDSPGGRWGAVPRLLLEKVPLLLLAAASCVLTMVAQQGGGALYFLARIPLLSRVRNALLSYAAYLWNTFWPASLALFYPHPEDMHGHIPGWKLILCATVLAAVTLYAWLRRTREPYLLTGWLWYLGTLFPVIGLVPFGAQAMADRYTYVPLVGIFVMLAFGGSRLFRERELPSWSAPALALAAVLALVPVARVQASYWRNDVTLFGRAVAVTEGNWFAREKLGSALKKAGRNDEAIVQLREAVRIFPEYAIAHGQLAEALYDRGDGDQAIEEWRLVLGVDPERYDAHANLGMMLYERGDRAGAAFHLRAALALRPGNPILESMASMAEK